MDITKHWLKREPFMFMRYLKAPFALLGNGGIFTWFDTCILKNATKSNQ